IVKGGSASGPIAASVPVTVPCSRRKHERDLRERADRCPPAGHGPVTQSAPAARQTGARSGPGPTACPRQIRERRAAMPDHGESSSLSESEREMEGGTSAAGAFPAAVAVMPDGSMAVADWVQQNIQLFAPDGRFLRKF